MEEDAGHHSKDRQGITILERYNKTGGVDKTAGV
jgi:hypothetical protein